MAKKPAIIVPRDFKDPRAGASAIDAIRIRLEQLEAGTVTGADLASLRAELRALVAGQKPTQPTQTGRPRSVLVLAESASIGDLIALSSIGAVRADTGTAAHAPAAIGLVHSTISDGQVAIAGDGDTVQSDAWSWDAGDILYAGADGALSIVPGSGAWIRRVGVAVDNRTAFVLMGEPIALGSDPDTAFLAREGGEITERQAISQRTDDTSGVVAARADGVLSPTLTVGTALVVPEEGLTVPEDMAFQMSRHGLRLDGPLTLHGPLEGP